MAAGPSPAAAVYGRAVAPLSTRRGRVDHRPERPAAYPTVGSCRSTTTPAEPWVHVRNMGAGSETPTTRRTRPAARRAAVPLCHPAPVAYPRTLLHEAEDIVLDLHPHWRIFFAPAFVVLLGAAGAIAAAVWVPEPLVRWIALGVLALAALWLLVRIVVWRSTHFVVTSDRLIHRTGVLAKQGLEIPLERVNNIAFSQGVIERMLRSGDLVIESAGEMGRQVFSDVLRPDRVQNEIYRAMERATERDAVRAAGGGFSVAEEIDRLDGLRARGVISDAEFQAQKTRLLSR